MNNFKNNLHVMHPEILWYQRLPCLMHYSLTEESTVLTASQANRLFIFGGRPFQDITYLDEDIYSLLLMY